MIDLVLCFYGPGVKRKFVNRVKIMLETGGQGEIGNFYSGPWRKIRPRGNPPLSTDFPVCIWTYFYVVQVVVDSILKSWVSHFRSNYFLHYYMY